MNQLEVVCSTRNYCLVVKYSGIFIYSSDYASFEFKRTKKRNLCDEAWLNPIDCPDIKQKDTMCHYNCSHPEDSKDTSMERNYSTSDFLDVCYELLEKFRIEGRDDISYLYHRATRIITDRGMEQFMYYLLMLRGGNE